jgi:RNA polymerase sigma-70 factor (ECF subfamily)
LNAKERAAASDQELVALALRERTRDAGRAAASELLGRHRGRVYVWCHRFVRDHEQALDLAQDVLLSAWRNLDSFQGRSRFSSWLFSIARNRCLSAVRAADPLHEDDTELDRVPDRGPDTESIVVGREEEQALVSLASRHLDDVEQEALWLRCFERLPVEEITRLLNIPGSSGARAVLQSARRKLRLALDRRDGGGP